jgi:hypothetical protein
MVTDQLALFDFDDGIDGRLRSMRLRYGTSSKPCGECENYSGRFCYCYGPDANDWPDANGCGLWRPRA